MPVGDMIVLNTLRYANELLPAIDVGEARSSKPSPREVQMAQKLVDDMTEAWKPERFHDTYVEDLKRRIEAKVKAGETKALTAPESKTRPRVGGGKTVDLMSLLEESLSDAQRRRSRRFTPGRRAAAPARRESPPRARSGGAGLPDREARRAA